MDKNLKQEKIEKLPLTNDFVFKRVFTKEGNESILKDLLEAILGIKINKVEIKNPEIPKETIEDKLSILDIKAQIDDHSIIDIEIQMTDEKNIEHRSAIYMSKNLSGQLQKAQGYRTLKKSIVINFLNFNYLKRNSYHSIARMKFEETEKEKYVDMGYIKEEEIATKDLEMHFIELPKFKKKNPEVNSKIEQWLWMIIGEGEKVKMAEEKNKEIKKVVEIIDEMSMDERERELYEARLKGRLNFDSAIMTAREEGEEIGRKQGEEIGRKQGEEIGRKQGERVKNIEIAKKLLKMKLSIQQIGEATGLTEEEIKKLENE